MYDPFAPPKRILDRTDYGTIRFLTPLHPDDLGDLTTHYYEAKINGRIEGFFAGLIFAIIVATFWHFFAK